MGAGDHAVLDVCCGSRMMWFDKNDDRVLFHDKRNKSMPIAPGKAYRNGTTIVVAPDVVGDFTALEFDDCSFHLVVFDPPHVPGLSEKSDMGKKYGSLTEQWQDDIRAGFRECFRVLKPNGILIFKWNEVKIPVREVLQLTTEKPLFGHTSGYRSGSHWITFMKPMGE